MCRWFIALTVVMFVGGCRGGTDGTDARGGTATVDTTGVEGSGSSARRPDAGPERFVPCPGSDGGDLCRENTVGIRAVFAAAKGGSWAVFVARIAEVVRVETRSYSPIAGVTFDYDVWRARVELVANIAEAVEVPSAYDYEFIPPDCYSPRYDPSYAGERAVRADCLDEPPLKTFTPGETSLFAGPEWRTLHVRLAYGSTGVSASASGEPSDLDVAGLRALYEAVSDDVR